MHDEKMYRMRCDTKCKYCVAVPDSTERICTISPARIENGERFYVSRKAGQPCDVYADTANE